MSSDGRTKSQVDHIAISKTWRESLLDVRNKRGEDVGSDHFLVIGEIRIKIAVVKSKFKSTSRKFNLPKLSIKNIHKKYKTELSQQYENIMYFNK